MGNWLLPLFLQRISLPLDGEKKEKWNKKMHSVEKDGLISFLTITFLIKCFNFSILV